MTRLRIRHETRYTYERPVRLGPHRLLLRPRESHAIRVVEAALSFSPAGSTRWVHDAMGNCVCWLSPVGEARALSVLSELVVERHPAPSSPLRIDDPHSPVPVVYAPADRVVLAPYLAPAAEDPGRVLQGWLRGQAARPGEAALDVLLRLNRTIHEQFAHRPRLKAGVQPPAATVTARAGASCDIAWLMVEALRRLGYAAVFATGYLHSPGGGLRGAGAPHAWCEAFLPDLGWIPFDPTNGLAESADLIAVAVARTPADAVPVSGTIIGDPGRTELSVEVEVRQSLHAAA